MAVMTPEQAKAAMLQRRKMQAAEPPPISAFSMGSQAFFNAPGSAYQFAKDVVQPFISPIETGKAIVNLGSSVLGKAGITDADPELANQVGEYFAKRYGGVNNAMQTFATDPVGMVSDVAGLLTGGGALATKTASKLPMIARTAGKIETVGRAIDPLNVAAKGAKLTGKSTAGILGLTSGAGMRSVEEAAKAGYRGGKQSDAFITQMRQPEKYQNVLDEAERAVEAVRQKRSQEYRAGMAGVSQDATVLNFAPIESAFDQIKSTGQYAGRSGLSTAQNINEPAVAAVNKLNEIITEWKALDPTEFHTPEGLDKLKQKIYNQSKGYPPNSPERLVADRMYKAVRDVVANQAPDYMRTMGDYEQASDLLKEFERSLSLNEKATADTTLRKLQSIMRNNANTNYGARAALGEQLVESGATTLMPGLAGQMMSSPTPRSLSGQLYGTGTLLNLLQNLPGALLDPTTIAYAGATSPRVIGETAYAAGKIASTPKKLAQLLSQYGDKLADVDPSMRMLVDRARRTIAAGNRLDPVYTQQLALQLSRLQEMDKQRKNKAVQEQ
jgi:hypothetical protein